MKNEKVIIEIKKAFVDYYDSEGCTCCENVEEHKIALDKIAALLNFKKYSDNSGYNIEHES